LSLVRDMNPSADVLRAHSGLGGLGDAEKSNMVFQRNGFPQFGELTSVLAEPSEFSIYGKYTKRYIFNKLTVAQRIDI